MLRILSITLLLLNIVNFSFSQNNTYSVSGTITLPNGDPIDSVRVRCSNGTAVLTDNNGFYEFSNLQNTCPATFFLFSYVDIFELITGEIDAFETPPWCFAPIEALDTMCTGMDFNPYTIYYADSIIIENIQEDHIHQDFIGIKKGNIVDEDAFLTDTLLKPSFSLSEEVACGETVIVDFRADSMIDLSAFQFSIQWDMEVIDLVEVIKDRIELDNLHASFYVDESILSFAWMSYEPAGFLVEKGETIFQIKFRVTGEKNDISPIRFVAEPLRLQVVGANCALTHPLLTNLERSPTP